MPLPRSSMQPAAQRSWNKCSQKLDSIVRFLSSLRMRQDARHSRR
jgi:hypothetical protein|eukprot:COSAG06_NODE_1805_length_8346_cov_13.655875_3_plen_45_part_00